MSDKDKRTVICDTESEAVSLANYELRAIDEELGELSTLLYVVSERMQADEDMTGYADALRPIARSIQEVANGYCSQFAVVAAEAPAAGGDGVTDETDVGSHVLAEKMHGALRVLSGISYTLSAMADERTEASPALLNLVQQLEGAYCDLYEVADVLEGVA